MFVPHWDGVSDPTTIVLAITNHVLFFSSTFTMTIILMVATIFPIFKDLVPDDVEDVILGGKRNLARFSQSVAEFSWHIEILERLDVARRNRIVRHEE